MSVFVFRNRWPESRVPYVLDADAANGSVRDWFAEVNECVGFALLVPKQSADKAWIMLDSAGPSKSEVIGCRGSGEQKIGGKEKSTVIHELLHALGFKHEQLHRKFPWDDADPRLTAMPDRVTFNFATVIQGENNKKLFDAIQKANAAESGNKPEPASKPFAFPPPSRGKGTSSLALDLPTPRKGGSALVDLPIKSVASKSNANALIDLPTTKTAPKQASGTEFYANNNMLSRVEALLDPHTEHWGYCDLDSVMMYGDFRRALELAKLTGDPGVIASTKSKVCDVLSTQDVAALRLLYPLPQSALTPIDFVVSFSGYPDDSLSLEFTVRSTTNPTRQKNYVADRDGRALVRDFQPAHAEIRVHPWQQWSTVVVDPSRSTALPGARYTYTVATAT